MKKHILLLQGEDETKCNNNHITMIPAPIEKTTKLKLPEKRMGLLRKPETKDHSLNAIGELNFDKENIALEMVTTKSSRSVPLVPKTTINDEVNGKDLEDIPVDITYRKPASVTLQYSQADELKNSELSKGNKVDSISKSCEENHSKLEANTNNNILNDLPCWLKPSAVQIYPYNFIMAVRRKLEALTDVRQPTSEIHLKSLKTVNIQTADKTSLSRVDSFINPAIKKQPHAVESKYSEQSFKTIETDTERKDYTNCNNSNVHPTQSQSETNSNLSSISFQLLQSSNYLSRTSSKKSNSIPLTYAKYKPSALASEDDTTISSSIFNSPEQNIRQRNETSKSKIEELHGTISPLSLKRVENLTIMSNKKLKRAIAAKHVNPYRGDSQTSCKMEPNLSHNKSSVSEFYFSQLLNDFNRSLSQVIEVNDRLKTTINKSHEICETIPTENSNLKEADDYTTDFEKCCGHRTHSSSEVHNEIDLRDARIQNYSGKENCELEYGDKRTFKHSKNISEHYINSSLSSIQSNELVQVSQKLKCPQECQQELDELLYKIKKSKGEYLSSKKFGLSKVCHGASEICPFNRKHKMLEISIQENCERAEHLAGTLTSTNISEENGIENISNIQENIESKTENESKRNVETLKTSKFQKETSERNKPLASTKHEDKPYQQHLLAKNITVGHKILGMFDHSNLEISLGSSNNENLSDSTCSYSNVGMVSICSPM